jgi:transcription antitermination factor NusG
MKQWFALLVKPRHEKAVSAALRCKQHEEFLPLRGVRQKWSDRFKVVEMPLLAGYTFCRFEPAAKVEILRTPGVRRVVGWGLTPVPVEEAEIEALQAVMRAGLPAAPCPYLRTGQPIRLDHGPLSGLRGLLLQSRGGNRLVVSITLLQRSVAVEVEQAWIRPADAPPAGRPRPTPGEAIRRERTLGEAERPVGWGRGRDAAQAAARPNFAAPARRAAGGATAATSRNVRRTRSGELRENR